MEQENNDIVGGFPKLLRVEEVQKVLRCCPQTVYNLFDRGLLRGPKMKPRRILASSLKAFIEEMNEPAAPTASPAKEPEPMVLPAPKVKRFANSRVALPFPGRNALPKP